MEKHVLSEMLLLELKWHFKSTSKNIQLRLQTARRRKQGNQPGLLDPGQVQQSHVERQVFSTAAPLTHTLEWPREAAGC